VKKEVSQCCGIKQYTQTEKLTTNRPDIIIKNKKEKTCTPIDVAIPADKKCCAKGKGKEVKTQ
jgi:hypothetical protein